MSQKQDIILLLERERNKWAAARKVYEFLDRVTFGKSNWVSSGLLTCIMLQSKYQTMRDWVDGLVVED